MARLLHLSDLHLTRPGTLAWGVLDSNAALAHAVGVLRARAAALGPLDAVLVSGDLSEDGSYESYRTARAALDRLGLPLLVIPGNHDRREPFRAAFAGCPGMAGSGPIDWTWRAGDCTVIGLDSMIEGSSAGLLAPGTLAHLQAALGAAQGASVIVALHHPPLRTGIRFMDRIGLQNSADLAAILATHGGPLRVLAGHVHAVHHGQIAGHPVSTAPSISSHFALDTREDAPVGFFTRPRGFALIDTSPGGAWSVIPLEPAEGPFLFSGPIP